MIDLGQCKIEKGKIMLVVVMEWKLYNEIENNEDKLGFAFQNVKLMKNTCKRSNSTQMQWGLTCRREM